MPEFYKHRLLRPFAVLLLLLLHPGIGYTAPVSLNSNVLLTTVLSAPSLVVKPSLVGAVSISWTSVAGASGYVLEFSQTGIDDTYITLDTFNSDVNNFRHTGFDYNQKVFYRIKAINNQEQSTYSKVVSTTTHSYGKVYKIMPLGDSNTEGGKETLPQEKKASYRSKLEELLNASASKGHYDFIGSLQSGSAYVKDTDHAGFGGARSSDILKLLKEGSFKRWYDDKRMGLSYKANYLSEFNPDIILLHLGTNDLSNDGVDDSEAAINNLRAILDEVDLHEAATGREVTVVLAKIIKTVCKEGDCYRGGSGTKNDVIDSYNDKIQALYEARYSAGDRIELVDMSEASIVYDYTVNDGDMDDRLHPNLIGFNKMAHVWFKKLDTLLNSQPQEIDLKTPETLIVSKPKVNTNNTIATFKFSSDKESVIYQVSFNDQPYITVSNPYSFSTPTDGIYTLNVRTIDRRGNVDNTPAFYRWQVDTQSPDAPTLLSVSEDRGPGTNDNITSDNTISLLGKAEPISTVIFYENSTKIGEAQTDETGNWHFDYEAVPLKEGVYKFSAKALDAANNISKESEVLVVNIDITAPTVKISTNAKSVTNSPLNITIEFSEDAYGFISSGISVKNGKVSEFNQLDTKRYTALIAPAADGLVSVSLPTGVATDLAGNLNESSEILEFIFDSTAPEGYSIEFLIQEVNISNQKEIAFRVNGAQVGAKYNYKVSDDKGTKELTGSSIVMETTFIVNGLDLSGFSDGLISAYFSLVDEAGNSGVEVSAQVQKKTRNIMAVNSLPKLKVPFKTTFEKLSLPEGVEVTYTTGEKEELTVNWEKGSYNGGIPSIYTLNGTFNLPPVVSNTNSLKAFIQVEVEANKPPTEIKLSSSKFKPDINSDESIGIFTTIDSDDSSFTYTLVSGSGDTDNHRFAITGDKLYLRSNKGLAGISRFSIRVRSTDPYQNFVEVFFPIDKTAYQGFQKVDLVNAFSPDGDGINDVWLVPELRYFNNVIIEVFDRSGNRLYHSTNPEEGWNGQSTSGQKVTGSCFYIIQVKDIGLVQKGVVTVLN